MVGRKPWRVTGPQLRCCLRPDSPEAVALRPISLQGTSAGEASSGTGASEISTQDPGPSH